MTSESARKVLDEHERLQRQLATLSASSLKAATGIRKLIEEANQHRDLMRAALGPLDELRRSGLFADAARQAQEISAATRQARELMAQLELRFQLPEVAETARLLRSFDSGLAKSLTRYQEQASAIQRAAEAMRTPWVDIDNQLRSFIGFAELQGIGKALRTVQAFDTQLADSLRIDLGDWRDSIEWPAKIFTDAVERTAFYAARGLDPALTSFPAPAFRESLGLAGLAAPPPPLLETYTGGREAQANDEEAGFERTNAAHDRLMRFETQLRKFIDEQMRAAFGENWIKQRVPEPIRRSWLEKQQKAVANGEPARRLIAYADFTDYVPIITRNDNWEAIFKPFFQRQTSIQESFQRLFPIRICTMHARIITQEDELYLYIETMRVLSAIGIEV